MSKEIFEELRKKTFISYRTGQEEYVRESLNNFFYFIDEEFQRNGALLPVLDFLASDILSVKGIWIALPMSPLHFFLAYNLSAGYRDIEKDEVIVYYSNNPLKSWVLILHELAHRHLGTIKTSDDFLKTIFEETFAYLVTFIAGYESIYKENILVLIDLLSRRRLVNNSNEMLLLNIIIPRLLAFGLSKTFSSQAIKNIPKQMRNDPLEIVKKHYQEFDEKLRKALSNAFYSLGFTELARIFWDKDDFSSRISTDAIGKIIRDEFIDEEFVKPLTIMAEIANDILEKGLGYVLDRYSDLIRDISREPRVMEKLKLLLYYPTVFMLELSKS
ncbi:MAG: hypothetical protein ACTSX9_03095 [Candidatus Njordarchaeales archaeon]